MSRVSRRGVIAGPKAGDQTYAGFQAHIAALATNGAQSWSSLTSMTAGAWRTTVGAAGGGMTGSSWSSVFDTSSRLPRGIQHGLPSSSEFTNQSGREIFYRITSAANTIDFVGLNRNGYTSMSYNDGSAYLALQMTEILYWDGTQAQRMTPNTGGGPTPYSF